MLLASGSGSGLLTTLRLLGHRGGEEKEDSIYLFWLVGIRVLVESRRFLSGSAAGRAMRLSSVRAGLVSRRCSDLA